MAIGYSLTAAGVTVGFHRLFTHRSFKTYLPIRALFAVLGSAAVEGPLIEWVSNHRMHHRFSDRPGDPHSPTSDTARAGAARSAGLLHAHLGWLILKSPRRNASSTRRSPRGPGDGLDRSHVRPVGPARPRRSVRPGRRPDRHRGRRSHRAAVGRGSQSCSCITRPSRSTRYATSSAGDRSYHGSVRNLAWLALPTFGEAWHNNHHAFPTSAHHGLTRWQLDPGGWLIDGLERVGLAWSVVRIAPATQNAKRYIP